MSKRSLKQCKFCGEESRLINAHIIPRKQYEAMMTKEAPKLFPMSAETPGYPARSPVGEYDPDLVCNKCERQWCEWDRYGNEVIPKLATMGEPISDGDEVIAYDITGLDYIKFKLFIVSVLWRMHATSRRMFAKVDLGETIALAAKRMITAQSPGAIQDFAFSAQLWLGEQPKQIILGPQITRMKKTSGAIGYLPRVCHMYMPGVKFLVKVDSQPFPSLMGQYILQENGSFCITAEQWDKSSAKARLLDGIRSLKRAGRC